jgi:hypothetical protein
MHTQGGHVFVLPVASQMTARDQDAGNHGQQIDVESVQGNYHSDLHQNRNVRWKCKEPYEQTTQQSGKTKTPAELHQTKEESGRGEKDREKDRAESVT